VCLLAVVFANDRTNSNPESTVGVLTMAGHGVDMIVSPTEEIGRIMAAFAIVSMSGKVNLSASVQIAQLALKHRKNKNGGQRIVVFIGSPVAEEAPALVKVGKLLKKNNVAVDVISLGEFEGNAEKLQEFVTAANGSEDNSHFMAVAPGVVPADAILSSPLVYMGRTYGSSTGAVGGDGADAGGAGNTFEEYGGIDPSMDPELAMAIRVSMEEMRSQAAAAGGDDAAASAAVTATPGGAGEEDEETLMQQALALSMLDLEVPSSGTAEASAAPGAAVAPAGEEEEEEMDEEMRLALAMSVGGDSAVAVPAAAPAAATAVPAAGAADGAIDQEFLNQLLGSVDADLSDPLIQAALAQYQQQGANASDDSKKRPRDEDKDAKK
jgi:26S proteasome regulatory subunit N10